MTTAGWNQLLERVNRQIEELEKLPLPDVKDKIFTMLEGIDAIHRESLNRLVSLFKEGVLEQVITDPPIHTLMELYDLLPPETNSPEAGNTESQSTTAGFPVIPIRAIPVANKAPPRSKIPHWVPVPHTQGTLPPNSTRLMDNIDGHSILLCRVDEEYFALASSCGQDGASLAAATINKYTLTCPNHEGCYYDVRQGSRIAADGGIECFPVEVSANDKEHVMIGLDMEFVPNLPVT